MNDHGMPPPRPEPPSPDEPTVKWETLALVAQNQVEIARILKLAVLGLGIGQSLLFLLLSLRFLADAAKLWCS